MEILTGKIHSECMRAGTLTRHCLLEKNISLPDQYGKHLNYDTLCRLYEIIFFMTLYFLFCGYKLMVEMLYCHGKDAGFILLL